MGKKKGNPFQVIEDTIRATGKAAGDTINTATKAIDDTSRQVGRLDKIILSPTNAQEEAAKDAAKEDARQREKAIADQKQAEIDASRTRAANREASGGSKIILGNKRKKKKKGVGVSSGLGLSKGDTGLQV